MGETANALPYELNEALQLHFARTKQYFEALADFEPEAVILGGGYGRGEGGIAHSDSGEPCLFNDLDYFIFTDKAMAPELLAAVKLWEADESARLGIDVEGKCLAVSELIHATESMMFFDLVRGHRVVLGPEDYLSEYSHNLDASCIRVEEATRLLWNRGSGLLFAKADLLRGHDLPVIHRNQSKLKLSLGDAILCAQGRYHHLAKERHQRLKSTPNVSSDVLSLHEEGLGFKLHPTPAPALKELRDTQSTLTTVWLRLYLELETDRLGHSFDDALSYVDYRGRLYPDRSIFRNVLIGVRDRLKRGGGLYPIWDYPRGALQRVLVLLLSEHNLRARAAQCLGAHDASEASLVDLYRRWWHMYS